jgi:hypothetical protein
MLLLLLSVLVYLLMFCMTFRWIYRNTGELYGLVTTYGWSRLHSLLMVTLWAAFWPIFWAWIWFDHIIGP